jgi:NAD(P)H-dependent flavin oxidoreductase YrpB (nitropropane dioxygenase family)
MFKTRVTELFGIKYPIVQGGMQWVATAELASAVSNAGGLGIISTLIYKTPESFTAELRKMKDLTDKPFGVNMTFLPTLSPVNYDDYVDIIIKEGVKIMETAGRNPEPYIGRLKEAGIKIIHKCTAIRFAKTAEKIGCDVISIDGFECAGHPGEEDITSLILTPLAAESIKIPFIASGGYCDARGLVAALALGADGVNMGTRFMATREAPIHPKIKDWMLQLTERDTTLVLRSQRNSERVINNSVAQKVVEMEKQGAGMDELGPLVSGQRGKELMDTGDTEKGLLIAGQNIGLIHDIPTVKEFIDRTIEEAKEIIQGKLTGLIKD